MTQTITTTYADPGPVPSGTPQAVGVQTLTWQSQQTVTASPAPGSATVDFHTVDTETEASPNQTTQTTSDALYRFPAGNVGDLFVTSRTAVNGTPGVDASDTTVATTYGSGNGLIDILPETAGTSWSNNGASTRNETDPGGRTARETVAAGGAYTSSATTPVLGGGSNAMVRTIADDADGSGTYVQHDLLHGVINSITYAAPANGTVAITDVAPAPASSASPAPAPTTVATTTTIPVWYGVPVALYREKDTVVGTVRVPSACQVPAQFGSTATQVEYSSVRTDTVLGTIETQANSTYDVPGTGVVCAQLSDTYAAYYDYSGANVALINFFGTNWQTTVTTQTLTLESRASNSAAAARSSQSVGTATSYGFARPLPVAFEAATAKVRRDRELQIEAALSTGKAR